MNLTIVTRSLNPLILEVSPFLSSEHAEFFIERTAPHCKPGSPRMTMRRYQQSGRTSAQHVVFADTPMLELVERQVAALANIPRNHQEHFHVMRYEKGQHYKFHADYFAPQDWMSAQGGGVVQSLTEHGLFNRIATVLFYLGDVEAGGATNFPRAGGLPQPSKKNDCTQGISIEPKMGRVMIWYSLTPDGALDELSLHASCDVESGTKWAASKWIWNKPMNYTHD
jgi:prolyl 4-hydroxylase